LASRSAGRAIGGALPDGVDGNSPNGLTGWLMVESSLRKKRANERGGEENQFKGLGHIYRRYPVKRHRIHPEAHLHLYLIYTGTKTMYKGLMQPKELIKFMSSQTRTYLLFLENKPSESAGSRPRVSEPDTAIPCRATRLHKLFPKRIRKIRNSMKTQPALSKSLVIFGGL
jgi:hypothetical protein